MSDVIGKFMKRGSKEVLIVTQLQRSEGFDLTSKFTNDLQSEIITFLSPFSLEISREWKCCDHSQVPPPV